MSKEFKRWAKLADLPKKPKKQQLDENIGGIVGIPAISQITHTPTEYETAFEHFLSEKYDIGTYEDDGVEHPDVHEPGAIGNTGTNIVDLTDMPIDEERVEENNGPYDYERKIVHKVIDGVANDFSGEDMMTREYINAIITALEELKITDF